MLPTKPAQNYNLTYLAISIAAVSLSSLYCPQTNNYIQK